MNDTSLAAAFALATAVSSASFSLIARRGQAHGSAVTGVVIGLILTTPLLMAATWLLWRPGWWDPRAVAWFVAAGITGPSLGRVFMYQSIHHLGVARTMPLIATMPLATALLATVFLGERPGPYIWTGTVLIAAGCAGITMKGRAEAVWDRRRLWMPAAAVTAFSVSVVFRKLGLGVVPSPLFGITVTYLSGLASLLLLGRLLPAEGRPRLGPGKAWLFYGACGAVNTLAFLMHFYAVRYGDLTIVTPLTSTSPFFALLLSGLLLRDVERVTPPIVAGTVLVVLGGTLIAWRVL